MEKTYLLFDYFKKAFHINKKNKNLYIPQLILILLKTLLIITLGVKIYTAVGHLNIYTLNNLEYEQLLSLVLSYGFKFLLVFLVIGITSIAFESGLYNMYKKSVFVGKVEKDDFIEGIKKYFIKFLLGDLLIILVCLILLPLYIILGLVTLFIGFALIPLLINIFLCMWKVSLVINDTGVFSSLKDSYRFGKNIFYPLPSYS